MFWVDNTKDDSMATVTSTNCIRCGKLSTSVFLLNDKKMCKCDERENKEQKKLIQEMGDVLKKWHDESKYEEVRSWRIEDIDYDAMEILEKAKEAGLWRDE